MWFTRPGHRHLAIALMDSEPVVEASNLEIADRLFLSERTVKGHVGSIFAKLEARDRAAAIIIAYEAGLVAPGGKA